MKVLQLCSKVPYPARDGGCLAMLNLADMLYENGCEVKILAIETHKHPSPVDGYPEIFNNKFKPESFFIDTKTRLIDAFSNLFLSDESYHLVRFRNKDFAQKLIQVLNSFRPDVVVLESLFTCGYMEEIKLNSNARIVYRAHNVEYAIWQEIAVKTKSYFKKKYLDIQSQRLKKEEFNLISKCDGILAITSKDKDFFKSHFADKKLMDLPFTVDLSAYNAKNEYKEKALFFIGAMDWYPNLEGVKWFIDKVWGEVLKKHPTAHFYVAGKAMPLALQNMERNNIINMGEVRDAKLFMEKYPMMVAPLFSGGGLKIKIVEAMAMGKIVICTPEAAAGIPANNGHDILFANTSKEFTEQISCCFHHLQKQRIIGENARLLIEKNFNTVLKGKELKLFLSSII